MSTHKILVVSDVLSTERDDYPGRHRIEGLCKYWARSGHEVHILTPGPAVPRQVRGCVYHFTRADGRGWRSRFPYLHRWQQRILRRVLIPDSGIVWYPAALRKASQLIEGLSGYDLLFSSFASASSHVIASSIADRCGIPWIADYRDLWTDNIYYGEDVPLYLFKGRQQSRPGWKLHTMLEAHVVRRASLITAISGPMADVLREKFGGAIPVCTVANGYDDDLVPTQPPEHSDTFVITYTGKLNNSSDFRELRQLLEVLAELRREHQILENKLQFSYWGHYPQQVQALARATGVDSMVRLHGPCSYQESIQHQREGTVLLLMLPLNDRISKGVLSRKLFDYLAARRPILGIVPRGVSAAELLLETGAGQVVSDWSSLKAVLESFLSEFLQTGSVRFEGRESALSELAFSHLAARMVNCYEQLAGEAGPIQQQPITP